MNWLAKSPIELIDNKSKLKTMSDNTSESGERHIVKVFPGGSKAFEVFSRDDLVHRINQPAVIEYYLDLHKFTEMVFEEKYFELGKCFLIKEYYFGGTLKKITKENNFNLSDPDGPAVINYNKDGTISNKLFYYDNKFLGKDLPISGKNCVIEYFFNSQILQ